MANILFIDDSVLDSKIFIDSCNENTIPFVYSQNTTRENVLEFLEQNVRNSQIQRLGFVFEINPHYIFLNEEPLFESGIISTNTQFLINIIQQFKIENIDFLACETLLDSEWNDFYKLLMENTKVIVGASNNKTGNLLFGGDWIMESTNTDIELIYFNKLIEYYKYLLGINDYTAFVRNGIVYACGDNGYGQLGDGTTTTRTTLVQMIIPAGKTPKSVNCGYYHTIVIMTNDTIWGCGRNVDGQLGINSTMQQNTLVQMINTTGKTPESVSCGILHTIVKMTDGTIYGCGNNGNGQLGINSTLQQNTLVQMINNTGKIPESVSGGGYHTIVKMTDGTIWSCGLNSNGQLGINSTLQKNTLTQMIIPAGKTPESVNCGRNNTIVKMTDGTIYGCGNNDIGQLGINSTLQKNTLTQMIIPGGNTPESVSGGGYHTIVKMTNGTIYGCGYNGIGPLGDGTTTNRTTLVKMINTTGKIPESANCGNSHTIVKMTDGTIWGCGTNTNGQLGDRTTTNRSTLVQIEFLLVYYNEGASIQTLINQGYTILQLYTGGITVSQLISAGITILQLYNGGITILQLYNGGISVSQLISVGITILQLYAGGISVSQLYAGGISVSQLYAGGITILQLYNGGITILQLISAGISVSQLYAGGITVSQFISAGYTISQLYAEGISIDNLLSYNIFNPSNNTVVYDVSAISTTLFTNSYSPQNIDVSAKNFKYYNLTTATYVKYNSISISGTGVLGFISNISDYNYGGSKQLPINTLRFFSFYVGSSTVKYYYDNSNNLFISCIGVNYYTQSEKYDIVIKISQIGLISVYYKSIDAISSKPIIGWVGNNSAVTNDDTFYKTFDGVQTFSQSDINGKFLIFDMTGLSNVMMNYNDNFIFNNNTKYTLSEITNIRNTLKTTMANTNVYNNLTGNQLTNSDLTYLGFSPTITNFSIPTKTYGNLPFQITGPTSNSTGSFSYTSSNTSVATIYGSTITIVGAGTTTITASQDATTNYYSGSIDASFQVIKATPTITYFSIPTKIFGDASFQIIEPSSNSNGLFNYTSSDTSVATISGTTVTIVGSGTTIITTTQAATTNYTSKTITESFTIPDVFGGRPFVVKFKMSEIKDGLEDDIITASDLTNTLNSLKLPVVLDFPDSPVEGKIVLFNKTDDLSYVQGVYVYSNSTWKKL
jgi:alpha-tubulin suppressor-like RCC1 family protein